MKKGIEDMSMVIFQPSGRRGYIEKGRTIKDASESLGVDIEGICGERGVCGKCKVRIEEGIFEKYGVVSKRENLSQLKESEGKYLSKKEIDGGFRLACQARIQGDIVIFVPEESRREKQIVRKEARHIPIEVKPAVKKYYVELPKANLKDTTGDWERLQEALFKIYGLTNLRIDYQVLLVLQDVIREGDWKITVSVWQDKEVIKVEPGEVKSSFGLAVDVGTTTVAAYLSDLRTGELVATESMMNPQVVYGEDVMSRISFTINRPDGLKRMNGAIIEGLNGLIGEIASIAHIKTTDIVDMTIVGNTCMHHLFLNINPAHIGRSPFPPAIHHSLDIKAREFGMPAIRDNVSSGNIGAGLCISPGAYVHVLPVEAGFVGADNVAVLIAETPYFKEEIELIIDIGTNGELLLGNKERILCASCATGPAFEGAEIRFGMRAAKGAIEKVYIDRKTKDVRFKVIGREEWNDEVDNIGAKGICGSGIIDGVSQLYLAGIIDKTGRIRDLKGNPRYRIENGQAEYVIAWARETTIGEDIVICQKDIRAVQLAKGAMYAGAKVMMKVLGVERVDRVILAGGFGTYIDKISAAILGMFPSCELEHIYSIGNAAGDGARMALLNVDKRKEADLYGRKTEYIELTIEADFNKEFAQAMGIPHMKDTFPHLESILPP
ncbi:MAG: ASKHA domain-containing protein [Syntrophorhabdaceae bacterium]|nr:ASKHA domain-containing protein [Syntrophorhabdaceae bacterium]